MNNLHIQYILYILCLIYVVRNVWGMVPRTTCIYILHCDCLFYVLKPDNQRPLYFISLHKQLSGKINLHHTILFSWTTKQRRVKYGEPVHERWQDYDRCHPNTIAQMSGAMIQYGPKTPDTRYWLHTVAVVTVKQVTLLVFQTQWAVPGLRMWAVSSDVIRVI